MYYLFILLSVSLLFSETFQQYQERILQEQQSYTTQQHRELSDWQQKQQEEYRNFQKVIMAQWGEVIEPSTKEWVQYDTSLHSVSAVDFEKGTLTVEVLVDSTKSGEKALTEAVTKVLESRGSSSLLDPTQAPITQQPVLENQVALTSQEVPELVREKSVQERTKSGKTKLVVEIPLVPDHLQKRMRPYLPLVRKYAQQYQVSVPYVLATIHTESYFNPLARSTSAGAIGLMQLMPQTGGYDSYRYVTGHSSLPSVAYLYNVENNIRLGCAYIYLLQKRYLAPIKNHESNRYCAIAGYNTGVGNVARTFNGPIGKKNGMYSIKKAAPTINTLTPSQVYQKLMADLPYDETKEYLKKVTTRIELYGGLE